MEIDQLIKDQKASINFFTPTQMSVTISQPQDDQFIVNGKLVYQDSNSNWIAQEELTIGEQKAFRLHLKKVTGPCENYKRP